MTAGSRRGGKRVIGCAIISVCSFAIGAWLTVRRDRLEAAARAQSQAHARLAAVVAVDRRAFEAAAAAAAAIPHLRAALRQGVDPNTILDLFKDEDWWQPYRTFAVAIVKDGRVVVSRGELPSPALMAENAAKAQLDGPVSALLSLPRPTMIASAPVGSGLTVVLAQPAGAAWLTADAVAPPPERVDPLGIWSAWAAGIAATVCTIAFGLAGGRGSPSRQASDPGSGSTAPSAAARGTSASVAAAPPTLLPTTVTGAQAATQMAAGQSQPFGRYTLIDRIGEGGMAEIFLASMSGAEGFQRLLVVKRLKPDLVMNPGAVAQFIDEAKLGSRLVHSNIVTVTDFGKIGDGYFLAEEYFAGRNLAELAARLAERAAGPLPIPLAFYFAHEVLSGLAYAHDLPDDTGARLNIVHRDVSPTNIMVSREGEVKLLDFGIVKADTRRARTDSGAIKGNAGYMSPEQARGKEVDFRSDLFSLGLVMFDLLTGENFYQGSNTGEVLYQAATGPTADHLSRLRQLPEPVAGILQKALALDPAARFVDAQAFALELGPYIVGAKAQLSALMKSMFGDELLQTGVAARATRTSTRLPRGAA